MLFPLFGFSQAPQKINFQSILRNTNGEVVSNKSVSLKISILSGSITGTSVYSETHSKTTDASGLISLQIGSGSVLSGVFNNIDWGSAAHFIKLEADFSGGSNYVVLGTQELMSVPYALYAGKTDTNVLNLVNRFGSKVNISDTASMLSNYRTGLNGKVNISDTSSMLSDYKTVIAELKNQIEQLSSYTSLLASGLVDIDGNNYPVVKIGNQIWMKENLRVSRYRNGDIIPVTENYGTRTGARRWYDNDSVSYEIPFGNLYNWYAVYDNRGLCPFGWHIPSDADWTTLEIYLGGSSIAGGKMKSVGTTNWNSPNTGATNESGFSALSGGFSGVDIYNPFRGKGVVGAFWSSQDIGILPIENSWPIARYFYHNRLDISRHFELSPVVHGDMGFSVRCIKNSIPEKPELTAISGNSSVSLNWNIPFNGGSEIQNYLVQLKPSSSETWSNHSNVNSQTTTTIITNLQNGITYDFRIAAVNENGTGVFSNILNRTPNLDNCGVEINDIDGNSYKTILIGNQCWFKENLKTSKFRNGGIIPNVVNNSDWVSNKSGAWSYYNNNEANNAIHGKLYNGYTLLGDSLCPSGWHVPNRMEWLKLDSYLGINGGDKLKLTGTTYWQNPNTGTNESGFSAAGSGLRSRDGPQFYNFKSWTWFWSKTESVKYLGNPYARSISNWAYVLWHSHGFFSENTDAFKNYGLSVRCLRD
jgi:uncharacterized protein (TIGR02145 family)